MVHRSGRRMRVFLGPQEISGLYKNLESGMVSNGVDARLIQTHPHPFDYGQRLPNPWPARWASAAVLRHRKSTGLARLVWAVGYAVSSVLLLVWCIPRFDAFLFGWGISILPANLDIPVLRLFRKRVVVVLGHGSEARPPYMATPDDDATFPLLTEAIDELASRTARVASKVRRLERWASATIGMRMTAQFFTRPFIEFYGMGVATAFDDGGGGGVVSQGHPEPIGDRIVVLHTPSNQRVKGTPTIRRIMSEITAENPRVEYRELSGAPHEEVLAALANCTFLVDQLWSDLPMATVGAEAASYGKATVIGGYGWDIWREAVAEGDLPPAVLADPDSMKVAILAAVADPQRMVALGQEAREFVRSRWSAETVAANYIAVLTDDFPEEWMVSPDDVHYAWGTGVPREQVRAMVSALVAEHGEQSLQWKNAVREYAD
ncbi:MAG: hypothetical protein ABI067_12510 [Leifsonia sp.]